MPRRPGSAAPHVELAEEYVERVLSGDRPACKWERLACSRYRRDRERELANKRWPYRFNPAKAERVCRFVETLPHTKGAWAARRESIRLPGWQCFILINVWGWERKRDGLRRFTESVTIVPRKNGKSTKTAAVGLYMLAADGEQGAEIYSGAATEKQAWEVFQPARLMALGRPELMRHYRIAVNASNINILSTASKFEPVIGKPHDGASPSMAIIDEFHEHDTPDQFDTMLTGMGARDQPLMWVITTAGDNLAGPCFDKILSCRKILDGVIRDEEKFFIEFSIDDGDDWSKPEALEKANPNIDISVSRTFLLARQREAIRNTREQGRFKTKHLNLWVNARSAYFNMRSWSACYDPGLKLDDLEGEPCSMALDLASKQDIAALVLLFDLGDDTVATFGRFYLPEEIVEQPDKSHYRGWTLSNPPKLIMTDGNMIDFGRIEDDIEDLRHRFTVEEITFDPAQATMLMTRLMSKGANVTEFIQSAANFTEPMKQVAALIDAGRLKHNCGPDDPMTWMMSNVTARIDAKDQVFPRKERPENKIDGPVALIMAQRLLMKANDGFDLDDFLNHAVVA
jgi:phage terminase large subunit-like protein